jgi:site-specific recombinase XerD
VTPEVKAFLDSKTRPNTRLAYQSDLKLLEQTLGEPLTPDRVNYSLVTRHLERLQTKRPKVGHRSLQRHLATIQQFLQFHGKPALKVDLPEWEPKPFVVLSPERVQEILHSFKGHERTVMELLYNGLTISEALCLTPTDVVGDRVRVVGRGGKTRWVPLLPRAREWINTGFGPPFPHNRYKYIGLIQRRFGVTLQGLRHSFALHLVHSGAPYRVVNDVLGSDVAKRYREMLREPRHR